MAQRIVAVYVRVSTDDQAASGLGLEDQRDRCLAYAAKLGGEVRVFMDAGVSAKSMNRPALQDLLKLVARKRVAAVVVLKLDRLTRRVRDLLELVDLLGRGGAELASVVEAIDTTTPTGRLMLQMLGVFSQWEREQIASRTRDAVAAKRRRGEAHGFDPLGSRSVAGRLEAVAGEVEAIDTMVRRRAEGASLRTIAAELQAAGVPTKRGGSWRACTVDVVLRRVDRERAAAVH